MINTIRAIETMLVIIPTNWLPTNWLSKVTSLVVMDIISPDDLWSK